MTDLSLFIDPPMPTGGERFGAWFDKKAADAVVGWFSGYLRHTEGEWYGRPFVLQPWQRDRIIRPVFGWRRADGTRLIRELYLEVPRKNGKTELAAGIALLLLVADQEKSARVYSAACNQDQAKIVFGKASIMASLLKAQLVSENRDDIARCLIPFKDVLSFDQEGSHSEFRPLSAKAATKHGLSPSCAIYDEVHEWPDGELQDVIHKGAIARQQPLEFYTTTAGRAGSGFGWEMRERARAVQDGRIVDPTFLPVIFAADPDDDWRDPTTWRKANPNFGVSVKPDFIESEVIKAGSDSRRINDIKRYHLNIWTDDVVTSGLDMAKWDSCFISPVPLASLAGRKVWAGLDLSTTTDLSALALVSPRVGGGYDFWLRVWMPRGDDKSLRERSRRDEVPYDKWITSGLIRATEGNVVDYDVIRAEISGKGEAAEDVLASGWIAIADVVDLQEIAIDRWNAAQITTQLMSDRITVVPFGQGYASMSAPSKEFERLVHAGQLNHGGNPVARWMASCVAFAEDDAGNMKPVKPERRKTPKRIDGIVAGIMALGRAMVQGGGKEPELTAEAFFGGVA